MGETNCTSSIDENTKEGKTADTISTSRRQHGRNLIGHRALTGFFGGELRMPIHLAEKIGATNDEMRRTRYFDGFYAPRKPKFFKVRGSRAYCDGIAPISAHFVGHFTGLGVFSGGQSCIAATLWNLLTPLQQRRYTPQTDS